jgi:ankyrin repeat protein
MKGELYEVKMAALLLARALNRSEDFYLASNMEAAGQFDDIVFKLQDKTAFIQLKYSSKRKSMAGKKNPLQKDGIHGLKTYFQSYCNMKQQWQNVEELKHCGTFNNASFVFYTNRIIRTGEGNDVVNNYWQKFLSSGKGKCVSFTKETSLMKQFEGSPDSEAFLSQLLFFSEQADLDELDELIKEELKILYGTSDVHRMFHDKVKKWWQESKHYLTHQETFLKDIFQSCVDNISEQKHKETEELCIKFKKDIQDVLRKRLMSTQVVHITSDSTILSCIKVHHSLQPQCHLLVNDRTLESRWNEVLVLWSRWCNFLVIVEYEYENMNMNMEFLSKILHEYPQKRLVLVGGTNAFEKLQHTYTKFHDHIIMEQLEEKSQAQLLNTRVQFQGYAVSLEEITGSKHNLVPTSNITQLLRGKEVLGDPLPVDMGYYIPRTLCCMGQANEKALPHEMTDLSVTSPVSDLSSPELQQLASPKKYENVDSVMDVPQRVVLVSAEPGMGKSALLTHLALGTKKAKPDMWVLRVNLGDFYEQLSKLPSDLQLHHIIEFLLDVSGITAQWKPLFRCKLETMENVCVMFDEYDEISSTYSEIVDLMLKSLQATKLQNLWVTTRPTMRKKLENKLSTSALVLRPFFKSDQQNFLIQFWKRSMPEIEDKLLNKFAVRLLQFTANNLSDRNREFMGNPLQSMLLAEAFEESLKTYFQKGDLELPQKFNMVQLYSRFVEQKFKIFNNKNGMVMTKPNAEHYYCKIMKEKFRKGYMISAVFLLFPSNEIKMFPDLNDMTKKFKKFLDTLKGGNDPTGIIKQISFLESFTDTGKKGNEQAGIIEEILKIKPVFIHRTFAEYFAALWLAKNFEKLQSYLHTKMFEPNFQIIKNFFDEVLAQEFPLHLSVLKLDKISVENLLSEKKEDVNTIDEGGRTALHLAVLSDIGTRDDDLTHSIVQQIIKILLKHKANPNIIDKVLCVRPLNVAEELKEWSTVELLLEKEAYNKDLVLTRQNIYNKQYIQDVLISATNHGCVNLVAFILECGVLVGQDIDILYEGSHCTATMLHEAARHGQVKLVQYLLNHNADTAARDSRYNRSALMWAAEQGHFEVVDALTETNTDVNMCDMYGYTALLIAAKNKRWDVAKLLSQRNADVMICDWSRNNVLHLAAESGHTEFVAYLLDTMQMDVECYNIHKQTPLWLAAQSGRLQVTDLLLKHNANFQVKDKEGHTPLEVATACGHLEVVHLLREYGTSVMACNT